MLRIFLFGNVRITHDVVSPPVRITPITQALLAHVVLHRHRSLPREVLAEKFWGDSGEQKARSSLSTALWRLRSVLEPDFIPQGTYLVTSSAGEVSFNRDSDYWLDIEVFEKAASGFSPRPAGALNSEDAKALEAALDLHSGEFMEAFYQDWVLRERERINSLYMTSLARLMQYYNLQGDYERSLSFGRRILQHDPLREEIHRDMIKLYLESGQRALAVRQYAICHEILETELGIPPMAETQALLPEATRKGSGISPGQIRTEASRNFLDTLRNLDLAMQKLDDARLQLKRAVRTIADHGKDMLS